MNQLAIEYPKVDQGVRVVVDGLGFPPLQFVARIGWQHKNGALGLEVSSKAASTRMKPGLRVRLEYFRKAVLHRLESTVDQVTPGAGGGFRLSLVCPSTCMSIQSRRFKRVELSLNARVLPIQLPPAFTEDSWLSQWRMSLWTNRLARTGTEAQLATMGAGGVRLRDSALPEGDNLFVCFNVGQAPIGLPGRIVWRDNKNDALGLEFIGAAETTKSFIADYVDYCANGHRDFRPAGLDAP